MTTRAARLSWSVGNHRIVVYADAGQFVWKRTTKLGEAIGDPVGPFDTIEAASENARSAA